MPFPVVFSPATTSDSHAWSQVLDASLGQPAFGGPQMPVVYVVDAGGKVVYAAAPYHRDEVLAAIDGLVSP